MPITITMSAASSLACILPLLLLLLPCIAVSSASFSPHSAASTLLSTVRHSYGLLSTVRHSYGSEPWQQYNQSTFSFHHQLVDHFSLSNRSTYSQRYFVVSDFQSSADSPVLFLLCGEYTCPGVNPIRLFPLQLAYELGALVVAVEHRYYGLSYPTPPLTSSLSLLNSRQALNDFAYFQQWYQQEELQRRQGSKGGNRWLVIGGSYPGALSAWYRLKYPHLVVGSLASSAVVEAILDFPAFDAQVERSAGPVCAAALRNITGLVEAAMPSIKSKFGCAADIHDGDFLFMIADSGVEGIQYGMREKLCNAIVPAYLRWLPAPSSAASVDLLAAFVTYTQSVFFGEQGNSCGEYDRRGWMDLSLGNADRSWGWQTCTEVGYWQVARRRAVSIRSQAVNSSYYEQLCYDVFGIRSLPAVPETNNYYGGWNLSTSNTFFTNGVEDPWQWAGVRQSLAETVPAVVVNCTQCAHCVDLVTPKDDDDARLKETRSRIRAFVKRVLVS